MGYTDIVTREFMRNTEVCADVLNYFLFQGTPVISPDALTHADPVLLSKLESTTLKEKERDLLLYWTGMEWAQDTFMFLCIENQTLVDYAMPARTMIYDSMQIDQQLKEKRHAFKKLDASEYSQAEFVCGFRKSDRLKPMITVVVFFSPYPWDGPMWLHDLYEDMNEATAKLVPDHPIHLISPYSLSDDDIALFQSDFHQVMLYIKYSLDKDKLRELSQSNPRMRYFGKNVVKIINAVVSSHLPLPEEGGTIDMCKAHEDIKLEGINIGTENTKVADIISLMETMNLTAQQAMTALRTPLEQQEHYLSLISVQSY